jgi:hypothetical protein
VSGLPARLSRIERLGADAILHAALLHGSEPARARVRPEEAAALEPGALLHLMPRRAHLFSPDGARLPVEAIETEGVHG